MTIDLGPKGLTQADLEAISYLWDKGMNVHAVVGEDGSVSIKADKKTGTFPLDATEPGAPTVSNF